MLIQSCAEAINAKAVWLINRETNVKANKYLSNEINTNILM